VDVGFRDEPDYRIAKPCFVTPGPFSLSPLGRGDRVKGYNRDQYIRQAKAVIEVCIRLIISGGWDEKIP